jgi:hypothetical protein
LCVWTEKGGNAWARFIDHLSPPPLIVHTYIRNTTETKPLTSPKTNLQLTLAQAVLAPNVMARGFLLDYKAAKKREWEAAEQQWRKWEEAQAN